MEKSPQKKQEQEQEQEQKQEVQQEINVKKKNAAQSALEWLQDNWRKSTILGVGAVITAPTMAQEDINKKADQEFLNSKEKITYTVSGGHTLEKKQKKGEKKNQTYETSPEDFYSKDLQWSDEDTLNINPAHKGDVKGSGETFKAEVPTTEGTRLFEGVKGEKEYQAWMERFSASKKDIKSSKRETASNVGKVIGSGENFRAEMPYRGGTRLFKGVEGEKEYKAWIAQFKKSGGRVGNEQEEESFSQKQEKQGKAIVKNTEKGEDFYAEIPTSQGTRVFKGEQGKKEYQAFQARMKNLRNNNMRTR